jgi:hypothetical protein
MDKNKSTRGWRHDSSGKVLALQEGSSRFKTPILLKKKKVLIT